MSNSFLLGFSYFSGMDVFPKSMKAQGILEISTSKFSVVHVLPALTLLFLLGFPFPPTFSQWPFPNFEKKKNLLRNSLNKFLIVPSGIRTYI